MRRTYRRLDEAKVPNELREKLETMLGQIEDARGEYIDSYQDTLDAVEQKIISMKSHSLDDALVERVSLMLTHIEILNDFYNAVTEVLEGRENYRFLINTVFDYENAKDKRFSLAYEDLTHNRFLRDFFNGL